MFLSLSNIFSAFSTLVLGIEKGPNINKIKQMKVFEIPITISYSDDSHSQEPISHGTSVIISTIKHIAIQRPLLYYGVTGVCFLIVGLIFGAWTIQLYSEGQGVMTNIALVGIGGVVLGTILLITGTILYSIVNVLR